ncbi:MAG: beta-galactosidase [Blautia faecis]
MTTWEPVYYPEHWSRELWQDDLQRMKAAGITVIRVAEFAWNKVEPEEDVFYLISGMNFWNYVNWKKCR